MKIENVIGPDPNIGIKIGNRLFLFFFSRFYIYYNIVNASRFRYSLGIDIDQDHDLVDTNRDHEVQVGVRRNPDAQTENVPRKKVNKCV